MLSEAFTILTITGVWYPLHWSSRASRILYKLYSCVIICLMYTLGFSQLARIVFVKQSFTDFNDTFFILLSTNFACFKAASNLSNRGQVVRLLNMFKEDCCASHDAFEKSLQKRYDEHSRKLALILLVLVEVTSVFVVIAPLFAEGRELPYKVLLPYDLGEALPYWLTFAHHALGAAAFTAISITSDALITGFMVQVCGQLDLLQHRLRMLPGRVAEVYERTASLETRRRRERKLLAQSVDHHVNVHKIAKTICTTFSDIIICQFFVSALEICVSVYQLSVRTTNVIELCTYSLYLICMLGQLFVYCYFGNEVNLQSKKISYTIFSIDWTPMSVELQKDLMLMNLLSSKPITMSCGVLVHLLLDSFTSIIRISYSSFNVLHSSV